MSKHQGKRYRKIILNIVLTKLYLKQKRKIQRINRIKKFDTIYDKLGPVRVFPVKTEVFSTEIHYVPFHFTAI